MNLSPDEIELFYSAWMPLLQFVNERRRVAPGVVIGGSAAVDPESAVKMRDALWAEPSLLDDFLRENPAGLSQEALALASSWRYRRAGTFIVYRPLKSYTVVLEDVRPVQVFGVLGLNTAIEEMVPWLPGMVRGVLLPFGDRIVFDGLLSAYSVRFGPGIRSQFANAYRAAKGRIITSLGPALKPVPASAGGKAPSTGASLPKKRAKPTTKKPAKEKALTSPGRCGGCGEAFSKRSIGRHVDGCEALFPPGTGKESSRFRLLVDSPAMPEYWIQVEAGTPTTLRDLDRFLRDTWLECCGHLSAFKIGGVSFASTVDKSGWGADEERTMGAKISGLVDVPSWGYEYDYGTTTALRVRPAGMRLGRATGVRLLARNLPPPWRCLECGAPAKQICTRCRSDDGGYLCAKHAKEHECGEDYLLPVVNSPRTGQCGYTG